MKKNKDNNSKENRDRDNRSLKDCAIIVPGCIGVAGFFVGLGLLFGSCIGSVSDAMTNENSNSNINKYNTAIQDFKENVSSELAENAGIQNFQASSVSINQETDLDYLKLFGTQTVNGSKQFTNVYVSVDEYSANRIFDMLDKSINSKSDNYYKDAVNNELEMMQEIVSVLSSTNANDFYVENIGDINIIKNYFNEILTGEKVSVINNGVYGNDNRDFSIGNVLISDIRREGDSFVIDFVGLDEDLLFSQGVVSGGIGLSGSGLGLYVGTSNGTKVEEIKQLNNYSLTITTKGSSLDEKLNALAGGDRNYMLEKTGEYSIQPNKTSNSHIVDSYNSYFEIEMQ